MSDKEYDSIEHEWTEEVWPLLIARAGLIRDDLKANDWLKVVKVMTIDELEFVTTNSELSWRTDWFELVMSELAERSLFS